MTSRDWQVERRAVVDRDEYACRSCGFEDAGDSRTALEIHPIDTAESGPGTHAHESAFVTVCTDCSTTLRGDHAGIPETPTALFERVRETTQRQGGAISEVASFASLATSLPSALEADEIPAKSVDETNVESADEGQTAAENAASDPLEEYCRTRRDAILALDLADAHLEALEAVDETAFDTDVRTSLQSVVESGHSLQSTLRTVVERAETVPAGLERCAACVGTVTDGSCSTCGLEARATSEWEDPDGTLAFERLFAAINSELQAASGTTKTLTEQTTTLAEALSGEEAS
ncbi:hypothetical protein [Natronorubrum daqingense]|uniref:Uncharacterized protein n=1 Tax=Natronorubrum daqingense TaxID=588898 RepID=A0A1P8RHT5_9EURY|nr:hypothetical protein [Natronorubrum daqingense]APX98226.1 hypothetical protein BB347_11115 [Natronorubrum daqingense]